MRLFVVEFACGAHHFLGVLDEISSLQSTQSLQLERVSGQDLATAFAAAKLEREMSSSVAAKPKISSAAAWTPTGGRAITIREPNADHRKYYLEGARAYRRAYREEQPNSLADVERLVKAYKSHRSADVFDKKFCHAED